MKILSLFFILSYSLCFSLNAEIKEIKEIKEILSTINAPDTLVFFDMDDTLTDSTLSLGTGAWRKYIRQKITDYETQHGKILEGVDLHDLLTFYVAQKVPLQPVEKDIPQIVANLQSQGVSVFVFTARGKSKWYSTEIENIDQLTQSQLSSIGLHFEQSVVPEKLKMMDPAFYTEGVIYSSPLKKGQCLINILKTTGYLPSSIIFIDDKLDQVQSMEKATNELGIPFIGFWYRRAEFEHLNFDPAIATLQLMMLLDQETLIGDNEAQQKKAAMGIDPDAFFDDFLQRIDLSKIRL